MNFIANAGSVLAISLMLVGGCSDVTEQASVNAPPSPVIRVPGQYSTIQAAIDAASSGDTIFVANGIYTGDGNRDIYFKGKALTLLSDYGAAFCVIDCEGTAEVPHNGMNFMSRETAQTVVDGFTIRGGYAAHGAAIDLRSAHPTIKNCIFYDNEASVSGGAIKCKGASPYFINCSFVSNASTTGAAVVLLAGSQPNFENCLIAYSRLDDAILCLEATSMPGLQCCNVYGNQGGDFIGCIAEQANVEGNLSADPLFCGLLEADFHVDQASPCISSNNDCGVQIGALGEGCTNEIASGDR